MNEKNHKQDEEEKFYNELDKKTAHKSCCTCQTFIIFFFIVLVIISGFIFYLYWQITRGGGLQTNINVTTSNDFQAKIEKPSIDQNGQFQLVLTSDDLSSLLSEGFSTENFILKEIKVSINPSKMLIYGTLVKPLSSKVVIIAIPKVEGEKLRFIIENISAGNINLPASVNNSLNNSLSSLFDKKLADFYQKYTVDKVILEENQIYIFGEIKK